MVGIKKIESDDKNIVFLKNIYISQIYMYMYNMMFLRCGDNSVVVICVNCHIRGLRAELFGYLYVYITHRQVNQERSYVSLRHEKNLLHCD